MFGYVKMKFDELRRVDWILIGVVLAAALLMVLSFLIFQEREGVSAVVIEQDGRELMRLPVDARQEIRIGGGDGGYNLVEIGPEGVRVSEADCPDLTCVHQGTISRAGETIICLPHRLVIRLEGGADSGPDAVAG